MSLPTIILKILGLLEKEGIKAEVVPMYGSCSTKYVITLPGVKIDNISRSNGSEKVQPEKHKVHSV